MADESMDLNELAIYLHRDVRDVQKMAKRGQLPGRKVSGQWRFARAEINHWLETQMPLFTEQQLTALETKDSTEVEQDPFISGLLAQNCMAVPLAASTRPSVLKELVRLAEQSCQVYDPDAILEAIRLREEIASTALESGVAIPHPRRPLPSALGESVIAYGRTGTGIPFGAAHGGLTRIFFLICCREEKTHIRVLARLSRLLLRPGFVDALMDAETVADTWQLIRDGECELSNS